MRHQPIGVFLRNLYGRGQPTIPHSDNPAIAAPAGKRRDLSTAGAALLGITDGTARQYLKAAFRKTHAHRQADLVRIVGGMLAQ